MPEAYQALERKAQEVHSLEKEIKYYTINTTPVTEPFPV